MVTWDRYKHFGRFAFRTLPRFKAFSKHIACRQTKSAGVPIFSRLSSQLPLDWPAGLFGLRLIDDRQHLEGGDDGGRLKLNLHFFLLLSCP